MVSLQRRVDIIYLLFLFVCVCQRRRLLELRLAQRHRVAPGPALDEDPCGAEGGRPGGGAGEAGPENCGGKLDLREWSRNCPRLLAGTVVSSDRVKTLRGGLNRAVLLRKHSHVNP